MDVESVALLYTPAGQQALALAMEQPDPSSLAAASALRARFPAELAALCLSQAQLRRRAVAKFGERAASLYLTADGLEQASRPDVAAHHAAHLVAAGVRRVVDLGCGIGADALAFVAAGLEVVCVEIDPVTAEIARLNLDNRAEVLVGDAESLAPGLLAAADGAFSDPARRTAAGRLWRVEDFTPSWTFVQSLLRGDLVAGVKLGPALPHALVPAGVEAEWVSHRGSTVEVGLWSDPGDRRDRRVATLLPDARLEVPPDLPLLETRPVGRYLYEPDGAVIRAGGITAVGRDIDGWLLDPKIAYLSSDRRVGTPFAAAFEVLDVLPYKEKGIRRWLAEHRVGSVEIKKRGVDAEPAQLRRRLNLRGEEHVTLVLTRTPTGAVALIARRLNQPS